MGKLDDFLKRHNVVGSLISGVGSIAGMIGQNKIVNKQIAAQREENRLNRYYNQMLARQQNQWNLEQWNRENAYNSPLAQMYRLRQAGLNPDLMYGQGNAAGSPEMTSGAPSEPQDMSAMLSKRSFGQTMQQILDREQQRRMNEAQIEAIKANTNKTNAETTGINLDNFVKNGTKEYMIQIAGVNVTNAQKSGQLTDAQRQAVYQGIEESKQKIDESKATVDQIRAIISKLDFDKQQDVKRLILEELKNNAEISELYSRVNLNNSQTKLNNSQTKLNENELDELIATFTFRLVGLTLDNQEKRGRIAVLSQEAEKIYTEIQRNNFDLQYDKDYKFMFEMINAISGLLIGASSFGSTLLEVMQKIGARSIIKGFGK